MGITTYGDITDDCANTGAEYNPMREVDKDGNWNPFQDSDIGRLPYFPLDDNNAFVSEVPITLLQNLEGRHSIMGRAISISSANISDCCFIGYEPIPDTYDPTIAYRDILEETPEDIPFMPEAFGIFGGFGSGAY